MTATRIVAVAAVAVMLAALAACGGALPNTALSRHLAPRFIRAGGGALDSGTPLATVIRDRHLRPPDRGLDTPMLEQLEAQLAQSDVNGAFAGITYELTRGNRLASDWIVQTPDRWGRRAADLPFYPLICKDCEADVRLPRCTTDTDCPNGGTCADIWAVGGLSGTRRVCLGHSDAVAIRLHDLIASAEHRIDINLLEPATSTRFLGAFQGALATLARSGRAVSVRILIGQYPPDDVVPKDVLKTLTAGLTDIPGARLSISVSAMRSCLVMEDCDSYSWNHSKIVSVDERRAIVGGHNWWSDDYLIQQPVHDLSMQVSGPAAASAAHFADRLWEYVCANLHKRTAVAVASWAGGTASFTDECQPHAVSAPPVSDRNKKEGGLPILAVGRMAAGITKDFADQSELARDLMLASAQHEILLVQQDLGFGLGRADVIFPDSTIDRLIDFLTRRNGELYIVLSNLGAVGNSGSTYSNDVSLAQFALHLRDAVQNRVYARDPQARYAARPSPDPVNALLCEHVHLAPYRFGPDPEWPGGHPIANHAKFWMVDGRTFYIGSDNMYPVNLQEFGYIVDDARTAQDLRDAYWTPLWQWSRRAAVSGPGVKDCLFRYVPNH